MSRRKSAKERVLARVRGARCWKSATYGYVVASPLMRGSSNVLATAASASKAWQDAAKRLRGKR